MVKSPCFVTGPETNRGPTQTPSNRQAASPSLSSRMAAIWLDVGPRFLGWGADPSKVDQFLEVAHGTSQILFFMIWNQKIKAGGLGSTCLICNWLRIVNWPQEGLMLGASPVLDVWFWQIDHENITWQNPRCHREFKYQSSAQKKTRKGWGSVNTLKAEQLRTI
jgi:hypothetical protein